MAGAGDKINRLEVRSLAEWHAWLAAHHQQKASIWVVHFKKHVGAAHVPFGELVDEALCWGWVDSAVRGVDDDRVRHLFSPRNEKSAWSGVNKNKVARLTAEGRMQPPGMEKVEAAKANGAWTFLDDVERLEKPAELVEALQAAGSDATFDAFPPSARRGILEWIKQARRPDTRARRIALTAERAAEGRMANFPEGRDRPGSVKG